MLAGLRSIDEEIWGAARVDGIPKWKTYLMIVMPMMRPVMITIFVIVASGSVRVYDLVVALTQGGPGNSSAGALDVYLRKAVRGRRTWRKAPRPPSVLLLATAIILVPWIIVEFGKKSRG